MSGVFGVIDPQRRVESHALASRIAAVLTHRDWYVIDDFTDPAANATLGRVGIGIFNEGRQPVCGGDDTTAVFFAGEVYEIDGKKLPEGGPQQEILIADLYRKYGPGFAAHLNGAFIIALWDGRLQRLVLTNDHFGLYPHFYSLQNGRLLFAPEMKGILCDPGFRRSLDFVALAQYVRFQHLLGERSFFDDLALLPPGASLIFDAASGACKVERYWTVADIPHRPEVRFNDAVAEAGRLLRAASQRLSDDRYRPGVFLSGGLDSRVILGMSRRRPIATLTYGARQSRDVYYAAQVARIAGSQHHWFDMSDGNWVPQNLDLHMTLTEGQHSWIHSHGIHTLPAARAMMDVNLTGWDGGTVMGHNDSIEPQQIRAVSDQALAVRLFGLFNQHYSWPGINEAEEQSLYCEPLRRRLAGVAFDSFREELEPYLTLRPDVRAEYFYIRNHCGRLTQNMITMYRSHIEVRFPFFDYRLFEFLYSLNAEVRGHKALYFAVQQREVPQLVSVPYDHDEFLPTAWRWWRAGHALTVKAGRRLRRAFRPWFSERPTLYADYENYLRRELRPWAEAIISDRRTTERGIFDPQFLKSLLDRHMSGYEQWTIGKIAPLMTFELMLRHLVD